MSNQDRPQMAPIEVGKTFKTFAITRKKGMEMPTHHATQEVVVNVHEGIGILQIDGEEITLQAGDARIIPAGKPHSLRLVEDFKATGAMALDAEINFE